MICVVATLDWRYVCVCVHACVCVCVCAHVYICVCECVCACVRASSCTFCMLALCIAMCLTRYVYTLPGAVLPSFYFQTYLCFQSCLSDLGTVSGRFKDVVDFGFSQLSSSAIKPRIRPLADAFLSISHNITEASVVKPKRWCFALLCSSRQCCKLCNRVPMSISLQM